jgi:SAM-dependent methyltransferase
MSEKMKKISDYTASNRAAWNASAAAFEKGDDWHEMLAQASRAGFSVLDETLTDTLRALEPEGRRAVQICCNNGRELLSLAALGMIPELGIDQADEFLQQARKLAAAAGAECRFLCADIYDLPKDVPDDFDLGLITIGVLNWMPDLQGFFASVAGLLKPGAPLVIYETHPMLEMFDPEAPDPFTPSMSYFEKQPASWEETITYDGSKGVAGPACFWFTYTMGEIVSAAVAAGLEIEHLTEHAHSNREVEFDIYQGRAAQMPMSFTLVARKKPGSGENIGD